MTNVLITGISGMAGSHMAEFLLSKGLKVHGLIRRTSTSNRWRIEHLVDKLVLIDGDLLDQSSLLKAVEASEPEYVINLAADSFVGSSWNHPVLMAETTGLGVLRMLEAVRIVNPKIRFFQASSSEMFGSAPAPQNEETPLLPRSPYGCAKLFGHAICRNYRESYGMFVVSAVLFNYEGPRRGIEFVTRKITDGVSRIKHGLQSELRLGNLDTYRDWSHVESIIEAIWLMLQQDTPKDFVCGSGETRTIKEFCNRAFSLVGLNAEDYIIQDPAFMRPAEVHHLLADCTKIKTELGWKSSRTFQQLIEEMVEADMERVSKLV